MSFPGFHQSPIVLLITVPDVYDIELLSLTGSVLNIECTFYYLICILVLSANSSDGSLVVKKRKRNSITPTHHKACNYHQHFNSLLVNFSFVLFAD